MPMTTNELSPSSGSVAFSVYPVRLRPCWYQHRPDQQVQDSNQNQLIVGAAGAVITAKEGGSSNNNTAKLNATTGSRNRNSPKVIVAVAAAPYDYYTARVYPLELSQREFNLGGRFPVEVEQPLTCPTCRGSSSGFRPRTDQCKVCQNWGFLVLVRRMCVTVPADLKPNITLRVPYDATYTYSNAKARRTSENEKELDSISGSGIEAMATTVEAAMLYEQSTSIRGLLHTTGYMVRLVAALGKKTIKKRSGTRTCSSQQN